jgi:glycolate oxidase iron-sulfur subunit
MMEHARAEVEPLRPLRQRLPRWPGLEVALPQRLAGGGAAGLYNVLEPGMAERLRRQKVAAIEATGAVVGNPGCAMQIAAGLAELGSAMTVLHPAELLDRAYPPSGVRRPASCRCGGRRPGACPR